MKEAKYSDFLRFVYSGYILLGLIRAVEWWAIGYQRAHLAEETLGFVNDVLVLNVVSLLIWWPYRFLYRLWPVAARFCLDIALWLMAVVHLGVVSYFCYQLEPLDIFLYQYSPREIWYTITTSGISFWTVFGVVLGLTAVLIALKTGFRSIRFSSRIFKGNAVVAFLLLVLLLILPAKQVGAGIYSANKSFYFLKRSYSFWRAEESRAGIDDLTIAFFQHANGIADPVDDTYPLLHKFDSSDVIGQFFNLPEEMPNIVFLLVEGLNNDFVHAYHGVHLMPFLEELKDESLYWNRAFTLGERSFAVVPSALGSLPYGEKGFTLQEKYPLHLSLVSLMHANDYSTHFFYGQGGWFHQKDHFLRFNNSDLIFDSRRFSEKYPKIIVGDDHYFWGYHDKDLFNQSFEVLDTMKHEPRFDTYYTGTMHSPFAIADEPHYDSVYAERTAVPGKQDFFNRYRKFLRTTLFTDDALRDFFTNYKKRDDYSRTIFVITGDHPMTEVPIANSLKRYHVPIIIYSTLLKQPRIFPGVVTHLDLAETLLAFLSSNYGLHIPRLSASLGAKLDTSTTGGMNRDVAFMNTNREIVDYFSGGRFISNENDFYSVNDRLELTPLAKEKGYSQMMEKLKAFRAVNNYVCEQNKILPEDLYLSALGYELQTGMTAVKGDFNGEYHDLLRPIPVFPGRKFVSVEFEGELLPDSALLVYQLTNKGNNVLWKGLLLREKFDELISLSVPDQTDTTFLSVYFWNRQKLSVQFSKLKVELYEENNRHH